MVATAEFGGGGRRWRGRRRRATAPLCRWRCGNIAAGGAGGDFGGGGRRFHLDSTSGGTGGFGGGSGGQRDIPQVAAASAADRGQQYRSAQLVRSRSWWRQCSTALAAAAARALGGAIFLRADLWCDADRNDGSADTGSRHGCRGSGGGAIAGTSAGGALFLLGARRRSM